MNRLRKLIVMLALLAAFTPFVVKAQTPAETGKYTVQKGDTLWMLASNYRETPEAWRELVGLNPFLKEPGRQFIKVDGTTVVLIRPGETLVGLEKLGIPPTPVPIESLQGPTKVVTVEKTPNWLWAILAFLGPLMVYLVIRRYRRNRWMDQDAVTSAPPIVEGGIPSDETERLTRAMDVGAVNAYMRNHREENRETVRVERIGPIEVGMISGEGIVGYADRARRRRIDPPRLGYRARFRFPDGHEDYLLSLQGCMNPCYYGEGLSGFRFVPNDVAVPAPVPTSQPAPVIVAPSVAPVTERAPVENGVVKFQIRPATAEQPAMISMTGVDITQPVTGEIHADGEVMLRFTSRK